MDITPPEPITSDDLDQLIETSINQPSIIQQQIATLKIRLLKVNETTVKINKGYDKAQNIKRLKLDRLASSSIHFGHPKYIPIEPNIINTVSKAKSSFVCFDHATNIPMHEFRYYCRLSKIPRNIKIIGGRIACIWCRCSRATHGNTTLPFVLLCRDCSEVVIYTGPSLL